MKFKNKEELSKAYDELEKKFTQTCQELAELKEQLSAAESNKRKMWQPREGEDETFWIVTGDGRVVRTIDCLDQMTDYIKCGNYFKTGEDADKQAKYNEIMNRFRKYVEAYSEPLDWSNAKQIKYCVVYDDEDPGMLFTDAFVCRDAFQIYASSEQVLKDAIIYSAGSEKEFIRIVFKGVNNE